MDPIKIFYVVLQCSCYRESEYFEYYSNTMYSIYSSELYPQGPSKGHVSVNQ